MAEASIVGAVCSVASFGTAEDDVEKVFHSDLAVILKRGCGDVYYCTFGFKSIPLQLGNLYLASGPIKFLLDITTN